jgi:hypothetical protein
VRVVSGPYSVRTEHYAAESDSYVSDSVDDQTMPFPSDALCFPHGVPIALCRRAVGPMHLRVVRLKDSLLKLSGSQVTALGQLLPGLLCGEESAFRVFWREGHRLSNAQITHSAALANQIAVEELNTSAYFKICVPVAPFPTILRAPWCEHGDFFYRWQVETPRFISPG